MIVNFFIVFLVLAAAGFFAKFLFNVLEQGYSMSSGSPLYVHFYFNKLKLPRSQVQVLQQRSQYYKRLSTKNQAFFEHRMQLFLNRYNFISRQGANTDDEIKVMIASAYVMLTFGMRNFLASNFESILIYPDSYYSTQRKQMHKGEFSPKYKAVVFSRASLLESFDNGNDNLNLAVHEFAHVVHLNSINSRDISSLIFFDQYKKITSKVLEKNNAEKLKKSTYFRIYAFTNEYEFIAVILEHFFESPLEFKREFPDLYKDVKLMINQ